MTVTELVADREGWIGLWGSVLNITLLLLLLFLIPLLLKFVYVRVTRNTLMINSKEQQEY